MALLGLLFWGGIIFLVVLLIIKGNKKTPIDYTGKSYAQGYWDGWRAREGNTGQPSEPAIAALIDDLQYEGMVSPALVSPVDQVVNKKKQELQNINIVLYVASFLLVAAAALFIGTSLPGDVKFIGTWLITLIFYVTGLILYEKSPKLRPAAVAFTGTGLALLPFTGLVMYNYILPDNASFCWLFTSLIGVVAFVIATVRLQSQIVAYFAVVFMISLSTSGVAAMRSGLLWYFVVLIGFGSLMTIVSIARTKWLPAVFTKPIQVSSDWIVAITLLASIFAGIDLTITDYEIIVGLSTLYYAAVALSALSKIVKSSALLIMRGLLTLFVLLITYDLSHEWWMVGLALTAVSVAQIFISVMSVNNNKADSSDETWLWLGLSLLVVAPLFASGLYNTALIMSYQLTVLLVTSIVVAVSTHRSGILFFGLYSLLILPALITTEVLQPGLATHWVALIYLVMSAVVLYQRLRIKLLTDRFKNGLPVLAYGLFLVEGLIFTASSTSQGWITALLIIVAVIMYAIVYIEKTSQFLIIANLLGILTISKVLDFIGIPSDWLIIVLAWVVFVLFYAGNWLLLSIGKKIHASYMFWSAVTFSGVIAIGEVLGQDLGHVFVATSVLILISLLLLSEGFMLKKYAFIDASIIIGTLALQRLVAVAVPDIDSLIYSQWWGLAFAGLAYMYYIRGRRQDAKIRLIIGLSILSMFGAIMAIGEGFVAGALPYRLVFLLEHTGLLVLGLVTSRRLLSIWGTVGVILAVFWMLSGYSFALLTLIALLLIGSVVYKLTRKET
ncbi:MAG: hypothetical protein ABIQ04_03725 [Candidatus Saccharimonadales bacterium]